MVNDIKKVAFNRKDTLEFEILDIASRFREKTEMMVVPHRAQFYHLLWLEKANGTHYLDFNPIDLHDNMLIVIPQNAVNQFDKNGHYEGKAILFTKSFFAKSEQDVDFLNKSMLFSDLYPTPKFDIEPLNTELRTYFNILEKEYLHSTDNVKYLILHNILNAFLLQSEREMHKQGFQELKSSANLDYLILFKEKLEKTFRKERSVKNYASALNISEKRLHKATSSLLDKTPKTIIDERVILEAKRLLSHGYQSIKEISYELGYDEPTNFIKYFRRYTNMTPSEFRENF